MSSPKVHIRAKESGFGPDLAFQQNTTLKNVSLQEAFLFLLLVKEASYVKYNVFDKLVIVCC